MIDLRNFLFLIPRILFITCTVGQNKKRNTPIYFNTNYHTEINLVTIIMDLCLLQFDAKIFLWVESTWGVST